MNNLSVFEREGFSIRSTGDGRFSVFDVMVAFGVADKLANAKVVLDRIAEKHPEVHTGIEKFKFPGRGQRETPIATYAVCEEILRILGAHPSQKPVTSDRFYPRTETQIVSVLLEAFADLRPIPQFRVHGYRIDLYLASANIAIEIDEHGHRDYKKDKDEGREKIIKSALGCSFVRFDPYAADFNIGKVIFTIRDLT